MAPRAGAKIWRPVICDQGAGQSFLCDDARRPQGDRETVRGSNHSRGGDESPRHRGPGLGAGALAADNASCYLVNPIDETNLIPSLGDIARGTLIVNIDSPVDPAAAEAVGVRITTYIGTDASSPRVGRSR
jgi:hypothetical protein